MILTEEAKVPIRCERCQVDPEVVSRSVRHSGVPGRHGKPLKENSPQRERARGGAILGGAGRGSGREGVTTPWTAAYQAPPSMGFSRQDYWSGVP